MSVARTPSPDRAAVYGRAFSRKTMSTSVMSAPTDSNVSSGATACQSMWGRWNARVSRSTVTG